MPPLSWRKVNISSIAANSGLLKAAAKTSLPATPASSFFFHFGEAMRWRHIAISILILSNCKEKTPASESNSPPWRVPFKALDRVLDSLRGKPISSQALVNLSCSGDAFPSSTLAIPEETTRSWSTESKYKRNL